MMDVERLENTIAERVLLFVAMDHDLVRCTSADKQAS